MKLPLQRWGKQLMVFLFPAETDTWVTVLRIGLGVQVVVYSLFLGGDWHYLFSSTGKGLVSRQLGEAITAFDSPLIPKLGWLVAFGRSLNISEETVLSVAWAALLCMGFLLLLGLFCRSAAVIAWFLHLCAAESGGLLAYGADNFMTIGLFYLMLSPLPDRYSLDRRLVKSKPKNPQLLGFWRRVLQVHLCLVYFFGGIGKCLGSGWWDGTNLWRSLTQATFQSHFTGRSYSIQIRFAWPRNFNLSDRTWLYSFHLDEKDSVRLAGLHSGDACRHRTDNGNVSFRPDYDCTESCRVRA